MHFDRDILGKIFFAVAILIGICMFFCPISNILIHIDEYWTLSLVNLPFIEGMRIAVSDVHPPLHYIIIYALSPITHNNLFALKVISIIPYWIILAISATKIRKDYGWLTCGVFAFTIATMSIFLIEFLTVRMYPWALLFMILAFIYFKEVIVNFDRRSWTLLTLFTLLGIYTHYFLLFTCGMIYLLILLNILRSSDSKGKIRQWAYSVISLAILYAPWFIVLIRQLATQTSTSHEPTLITNIFSYTTFFAINTTSLSMEMIILKVLAIIFLAIVIFLIYKNKANYEASGVFLMYATMIIGIVVLSLSFQPLRSRYLIGVIGIFWLAVSILLSKIESNNVRGIMLAFILVFSAASLIITDDEATSRIMGANEREDFLESINNNSTVIVYNTNFGYMFIHGGVNETTEYSLSDTYFYDDNVEVSKDIDKIMDKHPKDNIYLVNWKDADKNKEFEESLKLNESYDSGDVEVLKINK